jgi:tetratricopeptide (TPR) repeat protein
MGARAGRVLVAAVLGLSWLGGCETSTKVGDLFGRSGTTQATPPAPEGDPDSTGTLPGTPGAPAPGIAGAPGIAAAPGFEQPDAVPKGLLGKDPNDDLNLGKKHFRAANFGLAERHFRRAVELHPRDLEAWVGLAASYDRLRRWDMADRAYDQAMQISGATAELLNNKGYSLMLRGDYVRARETLVQAQAIDPSNPYVKNNLELLEISYRKGKAVR